MCPNEQAAGNLRDRIAALRDKFSQWGRDETNANLSLRDAWSFCAEELTKSLEVDALLAAPQENEGLYGESHLKCEDGEHLFPRYHRVSCQCGAEYRDVEVSASLAASREQPSEPPLKLRDVLEDLRSCVQNIECQCIDPPSDEKHEDFNEHSQYCPIYLYAYIGKLLRAASSASHVPAPPTDTETR